MASQSLLNALRVPHFVAKFPTESPMPFRSFFVQSLFVIEQKSQMHWIQKAVAQSRQYILGLYLSSDSFKV